MQSLPSIFNCSNDMALASGLSHYMPPKRIRQMEDDLASLSRWWHGTRFSGPWGWSAAMKSRYRLMGAPESLLPSDEWLCEARRLSSREHACRYISSLLADAALPRDILAGEHMRFCHEADLQAMEAACAAGQPAMPGPWIFKSPWSSSGRGVFVARSLDERAMARLRGFVSAQGGFAMDRYYEGKMADFAMEYYLDGKGGAEYLGLSVFSAADGGAYGFNYVEPQQSLMERTGVDPSLLRQIEACHAERLAAMPYRGVVGVDMMRVSEGGRAKVHPCVEINLRMNMGVLAILLWQQLSAGGEMPPLVELTEPREHGFQAVVDHGRLMVTFKK